MTDHCVDILFSLIVHSILVDAWTAICVAWMSDRWMQTPTARAGHHGTTNKASLRPDFRSYDNKKILRKEKPNQGNTSANSLFSDCIGTLPRSSSSLANISAHKMVKMIGANHSRRPPNTHQQNVGAYKLRPPCYAHSTAQTHTQLTKPPNLAILVQQI